MYFLKCFVALILTLASHRAIAQSFQWNDLIVYLPEGWSNKNNRGAITYSNYNLRPQFLQAITLFPAKEFTGRPDTLFSHVWKDLVEPDPNQEEIPRWRRFYTEGGILMQQGSLESGTKEQPIFRQLNVFLLDGTYQACLLETTDTKTYRQIQNEWQERLLSVKKAGTKKR